MDEGPTRQADSPNLSDGSWKGPFAQGAFMAVSAASLFWGAFLEFRPPAEESGVTFEETISSARSAQELAEWYTSGG